MRTQQLSDGEYLLAQEEYLRECSPYDSGYALAEGNVRKPAIILRNPMKNKEKYKSRDISTSWMVTAVGAIDKIFLNINFKAAEGKEGPELIRICIEKIDVWVLDWFNLLINSQGEIILNDGMDCQAIALSGIPLETPMAIVAAN